MCLSASHFAIAAQGTGSFVQDEDFVGGRVPQAESDDCDDGSVTRMLAVADANGDGRLDIFEAGSGCRPYFPPQHALLLNSAPASFQMLQRIQLGPEVPAIEGSIGYEQQRAGGPAIADVDSDGRLDLIGGSKLFINRGRGILQEVNNFPGNRSDARVLAGDLDGDGNIDAVVGPQRIGSGTSASAKILLNPFGNGTFVVAGELPCVFQGYKYPFGMALADVDNDADIDVLCGNRIFLNQGNGAYVLGSTLSITPGPTGLHVGAAAFGDFNKDGYLDLVTVAFYKGYQQLPSFVWRGLGNGSFQESVNLGAIVNGRSVAIGDLNNDGYLDFVIGSLHKGARAYQSYNQGTFCSTCYHFVADDVDANSASVALGDFDSDGRLDLLLGGSNHVRPSGCPCSFKDSLWINEGGFSFVAAAEFPPGDGDTVSVDFADMDGDGDLDVVRSSVAHSGGANKAELLVQVHCRNGGARLHAASACFSCPTFMGRTNVLDLCLECVPDVYGQGTLASEQCSLPCALGERPLGSDTCTACNQINGTKYDNSIVTRVETDPTTWTAQRCVACSAGEYADETGATCIKCSPGQFSSLAGSELCEPCTTGTFSEEAGSTSCNACQLGGYCESEGQSSALMAWTACPEGSMGTRTGLTSVDECEPCPAGQHCLEGRRGVAPNQTQEPCNFGYYCPTGTAEPQRCPPLTYDRTAAVGAGSVAECNCQTGFYTHTPANCTAGDLPPGSDLPACVDSWECKECPSHTVCDFPNVTLVLLNIEKGYWRQSAFSAEVRPCHNADACIGGANVSEQCAEGHEGAYCDVCKSNYFLGPNLLCEPCEGSTALAFVPVGLLIVLLLALLAYAIYKRGEGTTSEVLGNAVVAGLGGSLKEDGTAASLSLSAACASLQEDGTAAAQEFATKKGDSLKEESWLGRAWSTLQWMSELASGFSVKLRILIALWQVLGSLGIIFSIPYPKVYDDVLERLSGLVQIDFPKLMPMQCIRPTDFHDMLVLRTLLPLFVMGLLVAVGHSARKYPTWRGLGDRCPVACFYVLFLIYPSCCSAIFTFFVCDTLPDESRYLRVDYSIDCDAAAHRGMTAYALIMFLVYPIGTPLTFYLFLRKEQLLTDRISRHEYSAHALRQMQEQRGAEKLSRRRRLDSISRTRNTSVGISMSQPVRASTSGLPFSAVEHRRLADGNEGSPEWHDGEVERLKKTLSPFVSKLTEGYEMRCAKFEVFECVRKIFLVGIPALFEPGSVEQFMFGMLVCFMSYGMYAYWTPYQDQNNDRLQNAAQVEIFCGLMSWVALDPRHDSPAMAFALTGLLCVPPTIALIYQTGLDEELAKLRACLENSSALSAVRVVLKSSVPRWLRPQAAKPELVDDPAANEGLAAITEKNSSSRSIELTTRSSADAAARVGSLQRAGSSASSSSSLGRAPQI